MVRDSKDPAMATLAFAAGAWQRFTSDIKLRVLRASQLMVSCYAAGQSQREAWLCQRVYRQRQDQYIK